MKNGIIVLKLSNSIFIQSKKRRILFGHAIKSASYLTDSVLKNWDKATIKYIFHELILVGPFKFEIQIEIQIIWTETGKFQCQKSLSLCWIKVVENRRNLIIAPWKLKQHQTKTKIYPKTNFVACHYIFSSNPKLQHKFWNNLEQLWEDKKWKKWDKLLFVIYFDVWCNSFNFFHISEGPAASQSC